MAANTQMHRGQHSGALFLLFVRTHTFLLNSAASRDTSFCFRSSGRPLDSDLYRRRCALAARPPCVGSISVGCREWAVEVGWGGGTGGWPGSLDLAGQAITVTLSCRVQQIPPPGAGPRSSSLPCCQDGRLQTPFPKPHLVAQLVQRVVCNAELSLLALDLGLDRRGAGGRRRQLRRRGGKNLGWRWVQATTETWRLAG